VNFPVQDREYLLRVGGLGPSCLQRLEEVGIDSLHKLRALGAERATDLVCAHLGTKAWRNRRQSIERALKACRAAGDPLPRAHGSAASIGGA